MTDRDYLIKVMCALREHAENGSSLLSERLPDNMMTVAQQRIIADNIALQLYGHT
jgi:hypothetical protein